MLKKVFTFDKIFVRNFRKNLIKNHETKEKKKLHHKEEKSPLFRRKLFLRKKNLANGN
jgi:hypothetical protein